MYDKAKTYEFLNETGIEYTIYEHDPVYTIEEMNALDLPDHDKVLKNLFLRDDKKRNYYLASMFGDKSINMKDLAAKIPSRKLSFANEKELKNFLGLEQGHVTPLGVLNNEDKEVVVVFDEALKGQEVCIHPNENTASIYMKFEDLKKIIEDHGNDVVFVDI